MKLKSLLLFALVGVVLVSGTWALISASTSPVTNTFDVVEHDTEIREEISASGQKVIRIENMVEDPAYVRVRLSLSPSDVGVTTSAAGATGEWTEGDDGFWYYLGQLDGKALTSEVTVAVEATGDYADEPFEINVYSESCFAGNKIPANATEDEVLSFIQSEFDKIEVDE